jgi:hypothetical protein
MCLSTNTHIERDSHQDIKFKKEEYQSKDSESHHATIYHVTKRSSRMDNHLANDTTKLAHKVGHPLAVDVPSTVRPAAATGLPPSAAMFLDLVEPYQLQHTHHISIYTHTISTSSILWGKEHNRKPQEPTQRQHRLHS